MRLRNKKTGEVMGLSMAGDIVWVGNYRYASLADLNAEWEDYEPIEPLIKDEKIRKAVRAWAEANDLDGLTYYKSSHFWYLRSFNDNEQAIDFWLSYNAEPEMIEHKYYTIDELCGEEE